MRSAVVPVEAHDLAIVIPFRADGPARVENLRAGLAHLSATLTGVEIRVIENAASPLGPQGIAGPEVLWTSIANPGPFHRTRVLNDGMGRQSRRRFVASWDADVLVYPAAMAEALAMLREGAAMVLPYDGYYYEARRALRRKLLATPDLTYLPPDRVLASRGAPIRGLACLHNANLGGAVMFDRATFCAAGGYHEAFVAWGFEDDELAARMGRLGHSLRRVAGHPLIHLAHPRNFLSGWLRRRSFYRTSRWNRGLYARLSQLSLVETEAEIAAGHIGLRPGDAGAER